MFEFSEDKILKGKRIVMHSWETPIMEKMADGFALLVVIY